MPGEMVGQGEKGSLTCPKCGRTFKERHGTTQHVARNRCPKPTKKKSRAESRRAQREGNYNDPSVGRVSLVRGDDQRYHCPHCGKGLKRIDQLPRHVKHYCKAKKDAQEPPATENSSTNPSNDIITPPTWANPSRADFLTTLALVVPQSEWNDNPFQKRSITSVHHILSGDNVSDVNPWLTPTEKNDILATFNTATKVAQKWWQQANSGERDAYTKEWQQVRIRVQQSLLFNSSAIIFHKLVRFSAISVDDFVSEDEDSDE